MIRGASGGRTWGDGGGKELRGLVEMKGPEVCHGLAKVLFPGEFATEFFFFSFWRLRVVSRVGETR